MKRNPQLITILAVVLFFVGLFVLFYPEGSNLVFRWQAQKQIEQYNQVEAAVQEDYSALWEAAEQYNQELAERGSSLTVSEEEKNRIWNLLNPLGTGMMGYLEIPKIDVNLPIYQGTEERELQSGAGFWLGTSLPTGGESTHCVLTAHNGLVKAKMFTDLDHLEIGDRFYLHILDRTLTYEVDQILVTEPEEMEPLQIVEGQDYVTLYTCTPYMINTQRLLVRGVRVEDDAMAMASAEEDPWETQGVIPYILGVWVLLGLYRVAGYLVRKRRGYYEARHSKPKKKRENILKKFRK